jgi:hypothetical protein
MSRPNGREADWATALRLTVAAARRVTMFFLFYLSICSRDAKESDCVLKICGGMVCDESNAGMHP